MTGADDVGCVRRRKEFSQVLKLPGGLLEQHPAVTNAMLPRREAFLQVGLAAARSGGLAARDATASVRKRLFLMKYPHHPDSLILDIIRDDHGNVRDDQ